MPRLWRALLPSKSQRYDSGRHPLPRLCLARARTRVLGLIVCRWTWFEFFYPPPLCPRLIPPATLTHRLAALFRLQIDQWIEFADTEAVPADIADFLTRSGPVMRTLSNMGVLHSLKQQEVLPPCPSFGSRQPCSCDTRQSANHWLCAIVLPCLPGDPRLVSTSSRCRSGRW